MAPPPPKSGSITRRVERRPALGVPFLPWILVTAAALFVCTYVIDTDAIFDAACGRLHVHGSLDVDEVVVTYIILSLGWLAVACYRGIKLKREIGRRAEAETNAVRLSRTDALTGAANRGFFIDEVQRAIAAAEPFVLWLIDLDDFKGVNDLHGHAAGDAVLRVTIDRVRATVGPSALISRFGGDEFAVLIRTGSLPVEPASLLEAACAGARDAVAWKGRALRTSVSVGAAAYPDDAATPHAILHAADIAMYRAKQERKGSFRFYDAAMEAERAEKLVREGELRSAIAEGQVQPFYQPIVGLDDGALRGFEVLARWHHPRLGTLPPGEFLPLADGIGLMTALTESLLRQACRHAALMPDGLQFAINVSPSQLKEPGLAERLVGIVEHAGISTRLIEIELTEDAIMDDGAAVRDVIAVFHRSGMSVALDDFGTGYSSLSNLRQVKFDRIKIDRSFVQNLLTSGESQKLVDAILGLAASFDMDVTAEGIESADVASMLSSKGCDQAQGFHFGGPMCFDDALILSIKRPIDPRGASLCPS